MSSEKPTGAKPKPDEQTAMLSRAEGHTPGPWTVKTWDPGNQTEVRDWLGLMLAGSPLTKATWVSAPDNLPTPAPEWSDGTVCVAFLGNGPTQDRNAALIAAAPDLLAALLFAERYQDGDGRTFCPWCNNRLDRLIGDGPRWAEHRDDCMLVRVVSAARGGK